jgi:hypothetical protein
MAHVSRCHETLTSAARRHVVCSPGGWSPDKAPVRITPSARVCRCLVWLARRSVGVMRRHGRRRSRPGQGAPGACLPWSDPVGAPPCARGLAAGDAIAGRGGGTPLRGTRPPTPPPQTLPPPGTDVGSRHALLPQARSGAMSSSVRPAVSGKHRATSSAPRNARTVKAPMATQWDATTR